MTLSIQLNAFLKNTSQAEHVFTLIDEDCRGIDGDDSNLIVKIFSQPLITAGSFICRAENLDCFLKEFDHKYQFKSGQDIFVTVVSVKNTVKRQCSVETKMYAHGFHLAAQEWQSRRYDELDENAYFRTTTFRKVRQSGHYLTVMENLMVERDLHMDMLRECSGRSDAHVYRYVFAGKFIRKNDKVLDCACGLGYGSYILSSYRNPSHVTGVDICKDSITYANDVFSHEKLDYQPLDIDNFADAELGNYDVITSFETIEHVVDYHAFFKLCLAHLKPDGRVIASVPYLWVDETGKDPNPYHFHEFDWQKFKSLFLQYGFVIEERYHQTAPGGFKLPLARRTWASCNINAAESETEWLVVVATPDLAHSCWISSKEKPYQNPEYNSADLPVYLNFQAGYDNPWLHRQVVQIGQRIENKHVRANYCARIMASSDEDLLMLKTVEGYALDDHSKWIEQAKVLINSTSEVAFSDNPFVLRWWVSLTFLWARKQYEKGNIQLAKAYFEKLKKVDCSLFCSLLKIKTVESHYFLAKIAIKNNEREVAIEHLLAGKEVIVDAIQTFQVSLRKGEDEVATFLWPEMADMFDAGALLNNLLFKMRSSSTAKEQLLEAHFLENNKRFGLITLVDTYKQTLRDDETQQFKLIGQSYVNKLVTKVCAQSLYDHVYIWGTGIVGRNVCMKLQEKGISVSGFIDNNAEPEKQFLGLPVANPSPALFDSAKLICITSVGSSGEIASSVPTNVPCIYLA